MNRDAETKVKLNDDVGGKGNGGVGVGGGGGGGLPGVSRFGQVVIKRLWLVGRRTRNAITHLKWTVISNQGQRP